ncbi:TetR family transcriptional regulator [Streptomyces sp. CB01249]|uniref:TetR/AcrR family transcriptional regulator n=1 Tax=unclassified Streptomyces TaxID=2593676 RepID=UPI00093DAAFE|nr:TetR/AcrR family transcriptional regulator [Streptomyces sp. CB01249]OKI95366.1 TetR family transcriptional regulator [Streptomyces sp. CB01249]
MAHNASESRPSEARDRLLSTATRIFYSEGIHSVGVDRIVKEAQVTRATFYRHFPSKENLVVAYLTEADRALRGQAEAAIAVGLPAPDTLRAIGASIAEAIESPGFRGCAFLNAVAEYPDPADPVHQVVLAHRQWFLDTLTGLLRTIREEPAARAARHFVMLRDGAMAAGCLFDPELVSETFLNGVEGLLKAQATASFT